MTDQDFDLSNLGEAISGVYRGAFDDFVRRRDALAKQLRADKRREDADRVKALRKPSRPAWALNNVIGENAETVDQLAVAIQAAQEEQASGGGQLRAALENVRSAAREVAHVAARESIRAGLPMDAAALVPAVNAVIGDATAFAELRAGRLAEIPQAGGLDFMTAISVSSPAPTEAVEKTPSPARAQDAEANVALEQAEAKLGDMRARAQDADEAAAKAHSLLVTAEDQLVRATKEAEARRADHARAQEHVEAVKSQIREGQKRVAELRERMNLS